MFIISEEDKRHSMSCYGWIFSCLLSWSLPSSPSSFRFLVYISVSLFHSSHQKLGSVLMDPITSTFILSSSNLHTVYCERKGEHGIIDLGLSLRTLQPQVYPPSETLVGLEEYEEMMNWQLKNSNSMSSRLIPQNYEEESEGVESRQRWAFVKVNMDGVIVGRKVCLLHNGCYSSLALKLEDMFGGQSEFGLRLFQNGSEFSLFYKGRDEHWRSVGDVPWKEFIDCVKRMRIARRKGVRLSLRPEMLP